LLTNSSGAKTSPSSAEEGWTRHQENIAKQPFVERTGGAGQEILANTARLRDKKASQLFLTSRSHPCSAEERKFSAHEPR
jgi:hypothetical protein